MIKKWIKPLLGALTVTVLLFTGCVMRVEPAAEGTHILEPPPPPPAWRKQKPRWPKRGYVWVPGHWVRHRRRWVWRKGQWLRRRRGRTWVPAEWVHGPLGWRYRKGHWL